MKKNYTRIFNKFIENDCFFFIGGPCVIEDYEKTFEIASFLKEVADKFELPFIFKASYDKANRTSIDSFRGPGIKKGLDILGRIRNELDILIMSDVHRITDVKFASDVLDILQVPAFLCRQTDLIIEMTKTGKPINIKKGQFLAPWDVYSIIDKILSIGGSKIMITERGTSFGYNNLVVDFRNINIMKERGYPVVFDATHSVQLPGSLGKKSGGQRKFASILAKAAIAAGADGIFIEVHSNPDKALCDGPNSLSLNSLSILIEELKNIRKAMMI